VITVITAAGSLGLTPKGVVASPLPGPSGNVEFFVWFRRGGPASPDHVAELVRSAVRKGPQ
jgi:23S rRNA (cytidine1920-2'-O)/16S rRNA (cytidine1409-2'-O)-methyltransferase